VTSCLAVAWRNNTASRLPPNPQYPSNSLLHSLLQIRKMVEVAVLSAQTYIFDQRKVANWSTTQEKQISTDYPFTITSEPLEQHVARTYLQFLWLPEVGQDSDKLQKNDNKD